ncbi:MAG: hypothetical protein Q9227_007274 [Pyrenula ochraceoflavens]
MGNYVDYAVNVSKSEDVVQAISFASQHNIRFVIRNTGHDYNGKSTGAGALAVWMHNLKDISFLNWNDSHYRGKAIKMGAGVQGIEAYKAANAQGLAVVSGECPTVGIAGGYTQGGGHSALASKYGLGADQTLEFEVVTARGEMLTVNRTHNTDLYWALSGGGGGTYAVVMSLTSKAHPDLPTAGLNLTVSASHISQDLYYSAVEKFHATLPTIVDAGAMSVWFFSNTSFSIAPLTGPGLTAAQLKHLVGPLTDHLSQAGISYSLYAADFPDYLSEFTAMQAPIEVSYAQYGGWLIPRSVVETNNANLTSVYRSINSNGGMSTGVGINVSKAVVGDVDNAVLPAWRDVLIDTVISTPYVFNDPEQMIANQHKMTSDFIAPLEALAPQSGVYLSESDFRQPNWKDAFYGANYEKLLSIKNKYDPEHLFYALGAVGSDYWNASPTGSRMCKA